MFHASKFRGFLQHPGYNIPGPILAAIQVASTVASFAASKSQAKAQKQSIAAQQRISDAQSARERVQAVREARIRRAQILASTGNQGIAPTSSGPAGAVSSISSQLGSNIANINTIQNFAQQASKANQQAVDAKATGAMFQTIGGIAGGMTDWTKIFNPTGIMSVDQMQTQQLGKRMKELGYW